MEEAMMQEIKETLDPQDWDAFRELGHRMVEDMVEHSRVGKDWLIVPARPDMPLQARPVGMGWTHSTAAAR